MKIGVLSNNGITYSTQILLRESKFGQKTGPSDDKLQEFIRMKDKVMKHDRWVSRLDFFEIIKTSKNLIDLLTDFEKKYTSELELSKAQMQFIELGKHMLEFCDYASDFLRESYYQILILVLKRSELDLGQIGFISDKKLPDKVLKAKIAAAAEFQAFVYQVLGNSVKSM